MKLAVIVMAAAAALSAVYAQDTQPTVKPADGETSAPETTAPAPTDEATTTPEPTTAKPSSTTATPTTEKPMSTEATTTMPTSDEATPTPSTTTKKPKSGDSSPVVSGPSPLDGLKQKAYGSDYHMPYVRVVQARVQSDKPELVKGRFVSKYGNGDLEKGYMSLMDTVNTASVEGALMYVQAEGINQNARGAVDRCRRKNEMNYVVLYEILIAQTNETIAQFSETWNVPEYGPMVPMDSGRCTPTTGETFPAECLMFNGVDGFPNIGPFIGGGLKNDDVRAPYPNTFWFSFPHNCPLKIWGEKADANNACRADSRKGLCDMGKAPDGVECTYTYDVLGWVPIDDVVGITSLKDESGKTYSNFTTWCEASKDNIEFAGDDKTGKMDEGLPFWKDPLNTTRNAERASKVIEIYQQLLTKDFESTQIEASDLKNFKSLPDPTELAKTNPPCYKTVPKCNTGFGCMRSSFSQVCLECKSASPDCKTDPDFKFPTLAKAKTTKKEEELVSDLGGKNGATGGVNKKKDDTKPAAGSSASSSLSTSALGMVVTLVASSVAVALAF